VLLFHQSFNLRTQQTQVRISMDVVLAILQLSLPDCGMYLVLCQIVLLTSGFVAESGIFDIPVRFGYDDSSFLARDTNICSYRSQVPIRC